ncbi:cytosolic sulfotransferase 5-like [Chenopodium quinoa]|uniref:cytosolic sulfotransferase 5-like n=1 Tax=Chenopodium quinoa TaxID=63459 RepID=UPI000B789375|nr:cytosolic sulfotransferase 5-like [Chenopodium quinoa]
MNPTITPAPTTEEELQQLRSSLPKELWFNSYPMYFYQNCWNIILDSTISCQNHFQAQDSDIFIASIPKTGTTWLKSLIFAIFNRNNYRISENPLLKHNPHELIPQLESIIYANPQNPDLKTLEKKLDYPRILGTHLPIQSLPTSIKTSNCKIIYICRNPFDTFVSSWLFYLNYDENESVKSNMIDEYFGKFCEGKFPFGPFEDHVLGYWKQSLEESGKVLFVKFEDLKDDPKGQLKKLGEFVGYPFTSEEEQDGKIDEIMKLCSIEKLKEVEANKNGRVYSFIENKWFFRKGEVGDWVNYLSPTMVERFEKIMDEKCCNGLKL